MRFRLIVLFLLPGMIIAASVWANNPPPGTAYGKYRCVDNGSTGSWCNILPGGGWNWHELSAWSVFEDYYDCDGAFISDEGISNHLTCGTHGGGGSSMLFGTGIFPNDCFGYGPSGCGPFDYGDQHCGDIEDYRTQQMKDSGCFPPGFDDMPPDEDKNYGFPPLPPCNNFVGDSVNVATGNMYDKSAELTISSPGIPIGFQRFYNSRSRDNGPLGRRWTHSYNLSLGGIASQPHKRIVWDSDGRALYFNEIRETTLGETPYAGEAGVNDRLKQIQSTGEYLLRKKDSNLTYRFDSGGRLTDIFDTNGNTGVEQLRADPVDPVQWRQSDLLRDGPRGQVSSVWV
jgi:hypothetical protein